MTNLDGSRVAYTQVENGEWNVFDVLVDTMDPRSPYNPDNERVQAVGYAGDGVLVYNAGEGEDVEVRVFEPSADDYEVAAEPRLMGASAASEATGLVAGLTESRVDGSCWAAVRYDTGASVFEACDHSLGQFSPDGRHLIGTDAYGDGLAPARWPCSTPRRASPSSPSSPRAGGYSRSGTWRGRTTSTCSRP